MLGSPQKKLLNLILDSCKSSITVPEERKWASSLRKFLEALCYMKAFHLDASLH
jgi:hypothetical protein